MLISGIHNTSLVDYPGKLSAVVFTPYCNMNCVHCNHRAIICGENIPVVDESRVFDYLKKRRDILDAVVISGGEPTLRPGLAEFIDAVHELGYLVKLNTNGTNPEVLLMLIKTGRLDYVALDIKAPFEKYKEITGCDIDTSLVRHSFTILQNSSVPYEVRTVFVPSLTVEDMAATARQVKGAPRYCIQKYRPCEPGDPAPHSRQELAEAISAVKKELGFCEVRESRSDEFVQ